MQGLKIIGLTAWVGLLVAFALLFAARSSGDPKPGPIGAAAAAPAEQLGNAFAMVAAHVGPSVVSVYSGKTAKLTEPEFPFGGEGQPPGHPGARPELRTDLGSGTILDAQGHVLTNYFVVRDAGELTVQLADKRTFQARLVGADPQTDVAILRIENPPLGLPAIVLGDSDKMLPGHMVIAIGAPPGQQQAVTSGIVSRAAGADAGSTMVDDFLQTNAPTSPAGTGGPLVNMRGELVGVSSAASSHPGPAAGFSLAIPSNLVKSMLPRLLKGQKVVRGHLGVTSQYATAELARLFGMSEARGVLVSEVGVNTPAARAGLRAGDAIVQFGGHDVRTPSQLRSLVAATAPATQVKIDILREGKPASVTATITALPDPVVAKVVIQAGADPWEGLGLAAATLTPELARQLETGNVPGVVVTATHPGSEAARAGLQRGDVIVELDRQRVSGLEQLRNGVRQAGKDSLLLLVNRQGANRFVALGLK